MISPPYSPTEFPHSARWIVALTGASGMVYARRLLQVLVQAYPTIEIDLAVSDSALRVLREEDGLHAGVHSLDLEELIGQSAPNITVHNNRDVGASIASGSYPVRGMVVAPCSMSSLAAIAHGFGQNLIHRAADVTLKEGRRLVLVPRETPLSVIHLENMLTLAKAGARIVPAMPGFYHKPQQLSELVDMMVMKILDQMELPLDLVQRWKLTEQTPSWPVRPVSREGGS